MIRRLAAVGAIVALLGTGSSGLEANLRATAAEYYTKVGRVAQVTGRYTTMDYYQRLLDDADYYDAPVPTGSDPTVWRQTIDAFSQLDLSLAKQLLQQSFVPMNSIRGLGETFVRSSQDGTMQPVAVYVPKTYQPGQAAPLIVFLHGHPQSESSLISPPYITALAERTGTIVVAPYGRGSYDFQGSESDVYDTLAAAEQAFTIDTRKRYLVGYSMGGFSVYLVAPLHPNDWSGIMSIAGALLGSRSHTVTAMLRNTPFYILTGARDESIPTQYPTTTAVFLRNAGIPVTFYSDPTATHRLYTLRTILAQAWEDMEAGVVRTPWALTATSPLMAVPPTLYKI